MKFAVPLALFGLVLLALLFLLLGHGQDAQGAPGQPGAAPAHAAVTPAQADPLPLPAAAAAALPGAAGGGRTESAAAPGAGGAPLQVRFLDGAGQALPGAAYCVAAHGQVLSSGKADGGGAASLPAPGGGGVVVVRADGHATHWESLELAPGSRDLVVPEGAAVAGRVWVDGKPASAPVRLRLENGGTPPGLPDDLREALSKLGFAADAPLSGACDEGGMFRFEGLTPDFRGQLTCADLGFLLEGDDPSSWNPVAIGVDRPREDVALRLQRIPVLRGRVRASDGGPPPPKTGVSAIFLYRSRSMSIGNDSMDEEGNFTFEVRDPALASLQIEIVPDGAPAFRRTVDPIPADWNLGDILLPAVRALEFVVLDPQRQPVADARVSADDGRTWSAHTGSDGRGSLSIPLHEAATLSARAAGYLSDPLAVGAEQPGPVTVLLRPANLLRVRVHDASGQPDPSVRVSLSCKGEMLEGADGLNDLSGRIDPGSMQGASWSNEAMQASFAVDESGMFAVTGMRPGVLLHLEVLPPAGKALLEEDLPPMPAFGVVEREVTADVTVQSLRGRVLGPDGQPIPHATVSVGGADQSLILSSEYAVCDTNGEFTVQKVHGPDLDLTIEATDYVKLHLEHFPLPAEGVVSEFHLVHGNRVEIYVQDQDGNGLDATVSAFADEGSDFLHSERLDRGHFLLRGLPDGSIEVLVELGAAVLRRQHDTLQPELIVRVPGMGTLEVESARLPQGADDWVELSLSAANGDQYEVNLQVSDAKDGRLSAGAVPAGSYQVTLQRWDAENNRWDVLGGPVAATIPVGQTLTLPL